MLRFILVVIFLLLYFLLGIPILGILWLIGKVNKRSADLAALRIVQWGFKVILKISGVEVTVIGEDRVPDEPVLYVGNHRSYFDILLTYSRCRDLTGFVAKKDHPLIVPGKFHISSHHPKFQAYIPDIYFL